MSEYEEKNNSNSESQNRKKRDIDQYGSIILPIYSSISNRLACYHLKKTI